MRFASPLLVACCCGLIAAGCTSDLKLVLAGKDCNADEACVDGYACDREKNICVPSDQLRPAAGSGGSSGSPGQGGSGGWGSSHGGVSGDGSVGGTPGLGDDAGPGGSGVVDDRDGGPRPDASDGCAVTTLFRDADGDSFGAGEGYRACPQPGWVTNDDDCGDGDPLAKPGQQGFFSAGFVHSGTGAESYDYNCSGVEEVDLNNTPATGDPDCENISNLVDCSGSGFLPVQARTGEGVNALCGSQSRRACVVRTILGILGCTGSDSTVMPEDAFRCR